MNTELREELELLSGWDIPKCDVLEFLLRKFPRYKNSSNLQLIHAEIAGYWICGYMTNGIDVTCQDPDPKAAAMKLAIQLFKEGILTK